MCRTIGIIAAIGFALTACAEDAPAVEPPGAPQTTKTKALETGARVLQRSGPAAQLDVHLVGIHPSKDEPSHQLISHHYCEVVNEELVQCALWDSNSDEANLHGVEHIISSRLFESLSPEEQAYWHPHNYEILSGMLVAPGLPAAAEEALMKRLMNSYGKTWHVWDTNTTPDRLPLGDAELAWSFNADDEVDSALLEQRDRTLNIDTQKVRRARQSLIPLARPQRGVNALAEDFPGRQQPEWIQDLDDDME